jgi:DinB superfamily
MEAWLEDFKETVNSSAQRLLEISEAESEQPKAEEHWSSKQILGHLIDSAANNHARFVIGQMKNDLLFPGYDQDQWVQLQQYQQASWPQLVELWRAYNLHLHHVMAMSAPEKLQQTRSEHNLDKIAFHAVSKTESTTLEYLMQDYVAHLKHHLHQMLGG